MGDAVTIEDFSDPIHEYAADFVQRLESYADGYLDELRAEARISYENG